MQIQLMPYERGAYSRNTTCGSRTTDPSVAAGRESDVRAEWCRLVEPGGREEGGRSHAGGGRDGGSGGCGQAGAGRVGLVGRPAGPGGRGIADRMPCGRVWRVSTGRGAIGRSERGARRRYGALGASELYTQLGPGSGGVLGPPDVEGPYRAGAGCHGAREREWGAKVPVRGRVTLRLRGRESPEDPHIPCGGGDNGPGIIFEVWAVRACLGSSLACDIVMSRRATITSRSSSSLLCIPISIFPAEDLIHLDLTDDEIFTMPATGSPKKRVKSRPNAPFLRRLKEYAAEITGDPQSPAKKPRSQAGDGGRVSSPGKGSVSKPSDLKRDETKRGLDASRKAMKAMKAMKPTKAMKAKKAMTGHKSMKVMKSPAAMKSMKDLKDTTAKGTALKVGSRAYIHSAVHFTPFAPADRCPPSPHPPDSTVRHPSVLPSIVPPLARL